MRLRFLAYAVKQGRKSSVLKVELSARNSLPSSNGTSRECHSVSFKSLGIPNLGLLPVSFSEGYALPFFPSLCFASFRLAASVRMKNATNRQTPFRNFNACWLTILSFFLSPPIPLR